MIKLNRYANIQKLGRKSTYDLALALMQLFAMISFYLTGLRVQHCIKQSEIGKFFAKSVVITQRD